jgi:hypothetical protein
MRRNISLKIKRLDKENKKEKVKTDMEKKDERAKALEAQQHVQVALSWQDRQALMNLKDRYDHKTRTHRTGWDHRLALKEAIDDRSNLKELIVTEGQTSFSPLQLDYKTYKALEDEAEALGLIPHDYIRAIIYSANKEQDEADAEERNAKDKAYIDNRVVVCEVPLNREIREKMYKKHGQLDDRTLKSLAAVEIQELFKNLK